MTLDELDRILNNPAMKAIRQISDNPAFRQAREMERVLPKALLDQLNNPVFKILRQTGLQSKFIRSLESNPVFRSNSMLMAHNKSLSNAIALINKYSIAEESSEDITYPFELPNEVTTSELDSAINLSVEKIESLPKSRLSFEFYISTLINIAILVYSIYSASESEFELNARLDSVEKLLDSLVSEIEDAPIEHHFIVKTDLNLHKEPSKSSPILETLPPKLKVAGLVSSGDWLKVEYFDYLSNQMVVGWVDSSYLLPLIVVE